MRSLRSNLLLWVTTSIILLTVAAGFSLYTLIRNHLIHEFDVSLTRKCIVLSSTIHVAGGALDLEFEDLDMSEFASADAGGYLQIWMDSESIYRSPTMKTGDAPAVDVPARSTQADWLAIPSGKRIRGMYHAFEAIDKHSAAGKGPGALHSPFMMFIARDSQSIQRTLAALKMGLLLVGLTLILALATAVIYSVNRGMKPVGLMARRMEQLDEHSIGGTLIVDDLPAELNPILMQFNELSNRLNHAFERERSFSADIAHELRTPISGIQSIIDVALTKSRTDEEYKDTLGRLRSVAGDMNELIEGLLCLSALDHNQIEARSVAVSFDMEIENAWKDVSRKAAAKEYTIKCKLSVPDPIVSDPSLLSVALRNIFDNALFYVDDGGRIEISSFNGDGTATLRVVNTGSKVAVEDSSRVFDRLWRADASRANIGSRFGLGLSLCKLAVTAIGGSIDAESNGNGEFSITIELPASPFEP